MFQYDIVLFGASSFVGQIMCRYLVEQAPKEKINWALAGRNQQKLEQLKSSLGESAKDIPVLIADAADESSLKKLCEYTKVIVSTVGPYALYGEPLVKACVESGTDYCDLTGEPQWIVKMLERYETRAKQTGARIVHCCGFDSIPSDLGVYLLQQQAIDTFGKPFKEITMRVTKLKGTVSGGTIASMLEMIKAVSKDKQLRKLMVNPYILCEPRHPYKARQKVQKKALFDKSINMWTTPFVMAAINTRVVHRTNLLLDSRYGEHFLYEESLVTGTGSKGKRRASLFAAGLNAFMVGAAIGPTRWFMERFILPKPGEGPSIKEQENGSFACLFIGKNDDEQEMRVQVSGDKDPGYGSTAKMLSQAAICMARDLNGNEKGGFWTPASLMADKLIARLSEHAGVEVKKLR